LINTLNALGDVLVAQDKLADAESVTRRTVEIGEKSYGSDNVRMAIPLTTLGNQPEQAKVTQIELRQIDQEINEGISQPLMNYFKLIEEVINGGQISGLFRQDLNVRTARKVIFGAIDEVVTCWVMSKKPYDLSSLAGPVFNLLVRGLQK